MRSGEHGGNQIVADDTPSKLQVQVASDHQQSRLVVGYRPAPHSRRHRRSSTYSPYPCWPAMPPSLSDMRKTPQEC
ncbi:type VI secretion system Vgr family protein [Burkholderia sp. Bp9031]|uniref:type VI secretion system Vgr family protein n=1 Tax=Burkholderia sp. Bp9031 TaxID=2184566 RepID=UPI0039089317